jgi:hypothetical protein
MPKFIAEKISDGLRFGSGTISRHEREALTGNEDLARLTDAAMQGDRLLVPVDVDDSGEQITDDGCGDGRPVGGRSGAVFAKVKGRLMKFNRSLRRAKVFGGGATMAAASRIGLGESANKPLEGVFSDAMDRMSAEGLSFGAHTDNNAHDDACGCGAIDKAPAIIQAVVANRDHIAGTVADLMNVDTENATATQELAGSLNMIFDNYAKRAVQDSSDYTGRAVMNTIVNAGKVVKELDGEHKETRIILNTVEGTTVDQEFVREATGGRAQAFAVDVWRLQQLAQNLYADPKKQQSAFLSQVVYTLGTAAVLTKGDLPVYTTAAQNDYALAG